MMNLSRVTKDNLGMELLPDEILLKIFSYLPTYDNLRRIPLICKRFHKLSRDFTLIKDLYLTKNYDHPSQSKVINETIVESKYLYKLTIFQRTDVEDLILNAVKFCPKLCHLEILYCYCQMFNGLSDKCLSNIGMSLIFQVFIQQYEWIFHGYLIPFTDNVNGIYLIFREKFEKNQNRTAEAQTCAGESRMLYQLSHEA